MATPEELAAAKAAAQLAIDIADLAQLQAFQASAASGQFTVAGFLDAFAGLGPLLADDDRKRLVDSQHAQMTATLQAFAEMVTSAARAAGQGAS